MATVAVGKALYFPYIEFWSRVEWLKLAALYHDKIGRIVPPSYQPHDPDEVKQLIDEGFIEERSPARAAPVLAEEFYSFALDNLIDPEKRARLAVELRTSDAWAHIHIGKIDRALAMALRQHELLREGKGGWYKVEPLTGALYMLFLAKTLAGTWPLISDDPTSLLLAYGTHSVSGLSDQSVGDVGYRIASAAIRTGVPVDLNNVPMSEIISVRRKYRDERVAFFKAVGSLAKDLDNIRDDRDLEDAISRQEISIARALQSLSAKIASHRLALKTGLMSVTVPALVKSVGISNPIALVGAGAIAVGAVVWKHFRDVRSARLESSWSYLLTLSDEFHDLSNGQHFLRLGLDDDRVSRPVEQSRLKEFRRKMRRIGRADF
jgi:hypothetical protein